MRLEEPASRISIELMKLDRQSLVSQTDRGGQAVENVRSFDEVGRQGEIGRLERACPSIRSALREENIGTF
jgi:hypothetical protein